MLIWGRVYFSVFAERHSIPAHVGLVFGFERMCFMGLVEMPYTTRRTLLSGFQIVAYATIRQPEFQGTTCIGFDRV